jgi:hypothetical protein
MAEYACTSVFASSGLVLAVARSVSPFKNFPQSLQPAGLYAIIDPNMKNPFVIVCSIVLCLIIISAAFIGLVALNSSKLDASSRADIE